MADLSFKIFKSWNVVDEENYWVNTYEFMSDDMAPTDANARAILDALISAERAIHLPGVNFFKATISTWQNDSALYNPMSFVSVPLNTVGVRSVTGEALDANVCFFVKKEVVGGRYGKLYYRGCLTEADVSPRGDLSFGLTTGSSINTGGAAWNAYLSDMNEVITGLIAGANFAIIGQVKGNSDNFPGPIYRRPVVGLTPAGVSIVDTNHRWYNRSSS